MGVSLYLDVGGTYIKGIKIIDNKIEFDGYKEFESKSNESENIIFDNFVKIIEELTKNEKFKKVEYIYMAFPGPFDYETGVCKIDGLNKYASLYNINFIKVLKEKLFIVNKDKYIDTEVKIENDAVAFAYGNYFKSKAVKGAYFTIGTGFGSTFIYKGLVLKGKFNIPKNGMLYDQIFNGDKIDDLISNRGLIKLAQKYNLVIKSAKELFDLAKEGNEKAIKIFYIFGNTLAEILNLYLEDFNPDEIVLAGQIVKSYSYFKDGFNEFINNKYKLKVKINYNTSDTIIYGLYKLKERGYNEN